ncbi:ribonuclease Y [Puniceicoccales bacterium CK1056]|uniref:Ribonuclease Y n=1 Tax=Oceanipulchritudo coccoides TaxID=2706888 RepID=A0A6B2M3J2_9BACT|nr:ribonuclease Y [Oceanipulchritudo coccoides]NDV62250.1 ribonuclease Y [Oceanipulchritudo coccoides]
MISIIAAFVAGLLLAGVLALLVYQRRKKTDEALLSERCRIIEREKTLEIEELKLREEIALEKRQAEADRELKRREIEIRGLEEETAVGASAVAKEREKLEKRRSELDERYDVIERSEDRLRENIAEYRTRLQEVSQLTVDSAREQLLEQVRHDIQDEVRELKEELLGRSEKEVEAEAKRTLIACMQRLSAAPQEDITATIVAIPSDDMKGRIIGREGRNIKSFESMTGTTLLIDETPDSVLISSFDPVRRETARLALEALIKDGRIHPSSIEEAVNRAEEEVKQSVVDSGEDALRRLRLNRMHPEIVSCLGKLRFRLSNNQNSLEHSVEVANLCALIASELGLDTELAKRSGLLHDIGKVLDQDHEGSHALAGSYLLKRLGTEDPKVVNAVAAHHSEVPAESPYVALVMIADSLSATRPGVRADSLDGYLHRVRSLEEIAQSMEGVSEAYAIQAGREIRVIVSPGSVSEADAGLLARNIRRRIEDELQYPGTIKVTVIREQRFSETAQ